MSVLHVISGQRAGRRERVGGSACLVAVVVLGLVGVPSAAAVTTSATPSSTEPYRACPVATPGYYECEEIVEPAAYVRAKSASGEIGPDEEGTGELGGWSPENLKAAYKLPATGGKGETVAIVDAYNYPDAEADLKVFREHYKLSACTRANECFQKINQKGESSKEETSAVYPAPNAGWAKEMSLDVDMVSAVCPECKILLVEATNNLGGHGDALDTAENEAAAFKEGTKFPGTTVISNSWGNSGEYSTEPEEDVYFDHPGIQVVFAGGDAGYGPKYPATSSYVISAGGTQLTKEKEPFKTERKWSEEVWHNEPEAGDSTGSGCSKYEEKPPWQTDKGCADRTENDASAVAYHLSAYDSYERTGEERWTPRTGTSASTPIIAGIDALATSATQLLGADAFYKKPSMLFDMTVGTNGTCTPPAEDEYLCTAEAGYDGPTGEGTPDNAFTSIASAAATGFATKVVAKEATLNGIANPNGVTTKYYFAYGTSKAFGSKTTEVSIGSGTSNLEESKAVTGLAANTKYYFRLVTTNTNGTTDGLTQTLVTPKEPVAETKPASSVSETSATLNGIVNPEGAETKYYFEYGTTTSYGTKTAEGSAGSGTSNIEEAKAITGLTPGTTYDFRIVATNSNGTVAGANSEFKTLKKPSVETKAASGVTAFEATLNGNVNPNGAETKYYFEYGTTESYGTKTAEANAGAGTTNVEVAKAIAGLDAATTYHFRIGATNSAGTVVGEDHTFTTPEAAPVVVTNAATGVTDAGATLKGSVNPENKETKYYFEYGKTISYGSKTTEANAGSGGAPIEESSAITGLEPEVTYHFRIVATNAVGTSDGTDHTFTTLAPSWLLQTTPNVTGGVESFLGRVSCSSSTACTSVGEYVTGEIGVYAFAERWNGTEWKVQSTPSPTGAEESYLQGVSCASATACIATGGYVNSEGKLVSLAEGWNGTEWKTQTVPSPSGAKSSVLHVVSCKSSTECTAVGRYQNSEGIYLALAERWNGTEWKVQTVPNPTGTKESLFKGVSCAASTACTADGWYVNSSGSTVTLAESWNGTEWKLQTTPNETGATSSKLSGVSCTSSTACEANGWYVNSEGSELALAESWNGTEWKVQTVPKPAEAIDSILDGVSCFSSTDCTASGTYESTLGSNRTLAEHWNGTEWKVQTTLNVTEEFEGLKATQPSILEGISCPTATVCITTGIYQNDSGEPAWETMAEKSS